MKLNLSGETIESLLYSANTPVLELKIAYPQIMGQLSKQSEFRFNDYYCSQARAINRSTRTECYHRACEEFRLAREQEYDFTLHSFLRSFYISRLAPHYTSVIFDRYQYTGGPHGMTVRTANTWDFHTGKIVQLSHFFRKDAPYKKKILQFISREIEKQKETEEILFFENPLRNARHCFQEQNYYLSHEGITVFYPLYTLAPYYAGILNYKIPFSELDGSWATGRRPEVIPPYTGSFSAGSGPDLL